MFSVVKNMEQGTPEWLEFRRKHVTASDAGKILEEVPLSWGTPYTLWVDKIMARETKVNQRMLRGIELEPFARSAYIQRLNLSFEPSIIINDDRPWMMASLDGLSSCRNRVVEFKCGESAYNKAKQGEVASYYIPQLQHILAVSGLESIDYCAFWNDDLIIINVPRDEKYIQNLIEKEEQFYDCLINKKEPKSSLEAYENINSENALTIKHNLEAAIKKKKELEKIIQQNKDLLIEIADDRNIKIDNLKIRKKILPGKIDYKNIPELKDVDLNKYRKSATSFYTFIL